jgi:hypothetical protein
MKLRVVVNVPDLGTRLRTARLQYQLNEKLAGRHVTVLDCARAMGLESEQAVFKFERSQGGITLDRVRAAEERLTPTHVGRPYLSHFF